MDFNSVTRTLKKWIFGKLEMQEEKKNWLNIQHFHILAFKSTCVIFKPCNETITAIDNNQVCAYRSLIWADISVNLTQLINLFFKKKFYSIKHKNHIEYGFDSIVHKWMQSRNMRNFKLIYNYMEIFDNFFFFKEKKRTSHAQDVKS